MRRGRGRGHGHEHSMSMSMDWLAFLIDPGFICICIWHE